MQLFNRIAACAATACASLLLAGCENPANTGNLEPRATFYEPTGDVCRSELGSFARWDFFINPTTCRGCNVIAQESALDGDEFTAASILLGATLEGEVLITATAPEGEVFPAGTRPAVLAYHERTFPGVFLQADVRTRLSGQLQDQSGIDFDLPSDELDGQYGFNYSAYGTGSVQATKPFDTLELFIRFGPGAVEQIQVYEFCVDTND
nr:hypothetical protein [Oceanococcus sp. HetDA_MAG_MS8]